MSQAEIFAFQKPIMLSMPLNLQKGKNSSFRSKILRVRFKRLQ